MAFQNQPEATATFGPVEEPVVVVPEYAVIDYSYGFEDYAEVHHPAEDVYSQGFESFADGTATPDGWLVNGIGPVAARSTQQEITPRSGTMLLAIGPAGFPNTTNSSSAIKTFSGLTVGAQYTVRLWAMRAYASGTLTMSIGGQSTTGTPTAWTQYSVTFTATATSHALTVTGALAVDDVTLTREAWTEVTNDGKDGGYVPQGVTNERAHSGTYSARVHWQKNFSVVPGHQYTVTGWVYANTARSVQTGLFDPNDQVVPVEYTTIPANTWTRISGTFLAPPSGIATARVSGLSSGSFVDDVLLIHHVPAVTTLTPELPVSQGEVTLDEGTAPYALGLVTVPLMEEELVEQLDATAFPPQRVVINAKAADGNERQFDLAMMNRQVDHKNREVRVDLASDEYLLQSFAKVTDDSTPRTHEANLRNLINYVLGQTIPGASLQPGTTNADLTARWNARNMILDPGTAATPGGGYTAGSCTLDANDTSWSISGDGDSFNLHSPTSNDSFLGVGNTGGLAFGMQAGKTYVFSATGNVKQALSGTAHNRARRLVVFYRVGNVAYTEAMSPQVPNTVGAATRVAVEFTLPQGATEVFLRAYHGHTAGQIRWDGFRLSEKGPGTLADNAVFFDGDTPSTADYTYSWEGARDGSQSNRVATVERLPELFTWKAGVNAWDFLQPLINASGFRLYCDEQRRWFLIDPTEHHLPGRVTARVNNTTEGTDEQGGLSGLYATGVVVRYKWTDHNGAQREQVDSAGLNGRVHVVEVNRPFVREGMAEAILRKKKGQGRTQSVTVATDYTATPAQEVGISLPGTADQIGRLTSVTFVLNTGLMELGSSGLTETPEGAINLLEGTIDALPGTIDSLT